MEVGEKNNILIGIDKKISRTRTTGTKGISGEERKIILLGGGTGAMKILKGLLPKGVTLGMKFREGGP